MVRNLFAKEILADKNQELYPGNTGNAVKEDETYMATYPGNFSSDPNICLKKTFLPDAQIVGDVAALQFAVGYIATVNNELPLGSLKVDENNKLANPNLAYRLSQVWVNINFVTTLLKDLREKDEDEKQTVPLLDLVQGILTGINEACGGINNFRVIFNEDTSEIQILSEAPCLSVKKKETELTEINTYGFDQTPLGVSQGSFVTSLDLNSELSDKMATQITIGTAANGGNLDGEGAIFSSYSKGLKDTMFVDKIQTLDEETGTTAPTFEEKIQKILLEGEFADAYSAIYNDRDFSEDGYISTLKQINSSISPKIMERYFNTNQSPAPSFLPFNMSITMHGLGGIRIYDAFKIDGKVLPLGYNPDDIKLIIKSLSHSISLDGWKTTISTLSMPDNKITLIPPSTTASSAGASSSVTAATTGSSRKSSNYRKTAYPELTFTDPRPPRNQMSYKYAVTTLKSKYGDSLAKAVFAVMFAEASKSNDKFNSAGGHNYSGVQTDNARWGGPKVIIGQFAREDSVRWRSFAIFASDATFLDFMASRIKAKGFDGNSGNKWVTTYINKWWSPSKKKEYTKGTPKYNAKLAIYNSAMKRYKKYAG